MSIKVNKELHKEINLIAATEFNCNKTAAISALLSEAVSHRKGDKKNQETALVKYNQN